MPTREFITLLGGASGWPLAVRAQQSALPVIGYLSARSRDIDIPFTVAFRRGLNEVGYVDGQNVEIDFRWALGPIRSIGGIGDRFGSSQGGGDRDERRHACGPGSEGGNHINSNCLWRRGDPVPVGLVASLNRPGANITGVSTFARRSTGKRLELLHELAPQCHDDRLAS